MQRIVITINLDNAAFDDEPGEEVARILKDVIRRLENKNKRAILRSHKMLLDSNGNTVGSLLGADT